MLNAPADNDNHITSEQGAITRIFIFESAARPDLRAFAGDLGGSRLPKQFGPWRATSAVAPDRELPHELSRDVIEAAIKTQGFQLWRMSKKD